MRFAAAAAVTFALAVPTGTEIRGTVWSPACGVEPGVCRFVATANARVSACRAGHCVRTRSDRHGRYRLLVPRPGRYRLTAVVRAPFGVWRAPPKTVVARSSKILSGIDLGR